jgi:hypothetical protein
MQPHLVSLKSILTLSSHLRLGLPNGLFPFGFPTSILHAFIFTPIRGTCPFHLILPDLIILIILVRSTNYEAPHYVVFSSLPSLHLPSVQILSSAPCSQTPSVYVHNHRPVVLYGCETWSLTLREEQRLSVLENRVPRVLLLSIILHAIYSY